MILILILCFSVQTIRPTRIQRVRYAAQAIYHTPWEGKIGEIKRQAENYKVDRRIQRLDRGETLPDRITSLDGRAWTGKHTAYWEKLIEKNNQLGENKKTFDELLQQMKSAEQKGLIKQDKPSKDHKDFDGKIQELQRVEQQRLRDVEQQILKEYNSNPGAKEQYLASLKDKVDGLLQSKDSNAHVEIAKLLDNLPEGIKLDFYNTKNTFQSKVDPKTSWLPEYDAAIITIRQNFNTNILKSNGVMEIVAQKILNGELPKSEQQGQTLEQFQGKLKEFNEFYLGLYNQLSFFKFTKAPPSLTDNFYKFSDLRVAGKYSEAFAEMGKLNNPTETQ